MFIDKDSVIINGISMGKYCTEAKFSYNKLFSSDSGRNLAGTMSATLIGIFPKIILQFRKLTKEELNIIAPILDAPNQLLQYYDPNKNRKISITTYTGDWELTNRGINKNQGFSCSFIATRKRG